MLQRKKKNPGKPQYGSVLVLCLLFLLVLTVLGIAATQNTLVQERMAGGERDIHLAFQAAESGLRDGEVWLATRPLVPIPSDGSTCGDTQTEEADCEDSHMVWLTDTVPPLLEDLAGGTPTLDWADDTREYSAEIKLNNVAIPNQPRFVIEYHSFEPDSLTVGLAPATGRRIYEVSARGLGAGEQSSTESVVQSLFARQF